MSELIFVKQKDKDCIININNVEYIARHNDNAFKDELTWLFAEFRWRMDDEIS